MSQSNFKPERISKTASFTLDGRIEKVFPLFGPMREKDWAEGWEPEVVFSTDDLVEEHMIFQTKVATDEKVYTWIVTQFNPEIHKVEYTVSTKNRVWFITVRCTYTYTGLNAEGNERNRNALAKMYSQDLRDWQEAINYYLHHGKMLTTTTTH